MSQHLQTLETTLHDVLGARIEHLESAFGELTLTVKAADYLSVAQTLRDAGESVHTVGTVVERPQGPCVRLVNH